MYFKKIMNLRYLILHFILWLEIIYKKFKLKIIKFKILIQNGIILKIIIYIILTHIHQTTQVIQRNNLKLKYNMIQQENVQSKKIDLQK